MPNENKIRRHYSIFYDQNGSYGDYVRNGTIPTKIFLDECGHLYSLSDLEIFRHRSAWQRNLADAIDEYIVVRKRKELLKLWLE